MKKRILLLPALLLMIGFAFTACKENDVNKIQIKNKNATIVKECIDFTSIKDTFNIHLKEYPEGIISVFPSEPIKSEFREDGLEVIVSGYILKNDGGFNDCLAAPNVRLAPSAKFVITRVKKK